MDISTTGAWFRDEEYLWKQLIPETRRVIHTAKQLESMLSGFPHADQSPVVTQVFKAFEVELCVRVLRPFRNYVHEQLTVGNTLNDSLSKLKENDFFRPLGRFLLGGRPPALAESMSILGSLGSIAADEHDNPCALFKRWLRERLSHVHYLWGSRNVAAKMRSATLELRNPLVHSRIAGVSDVQHALKLLFGHSSRRGVALQALFAISKGLPEPVKTDAVCLRCRERIWQYPQRDPLHYCWNCPQTFECETTHQV